MGQLVRALSAGRKASILFKALTKVEITFNPFNRQSAPVREFLRRVNTPPVRKENPKLEIAVHILEGSDNPMGIALTYIDGHHQKIVPTGLSVGEIIGEIEKVSRWRGEGVSDPFAEIKKNRQR